VLTQESDARGHVVGGRPEHLKSDLTMEGSVVRQEHDTHPSPAELPLDLREPMAFIVVEMYLDHHVPSQ
jgi:hypothetical protein